MSQLNRREWKNMEFRWANEVEKAWNQMADHWSSRSKNMWEHGSRKDIVPFMQKHINRGKIIDVGCGDGYGTHTLQRHGFDGVGVDISEEMIVRANEQKVDETIIFHQADVHHLPFSAEQFDGALVINVLEWTEHPFGVLQELRRVIRPGGFICVGLLGPTAGPRAHSFKRLYGEPVICNTMMPWEWNSLAEKNGFTYIDGFGVPKKGMKQEDIHHFPLELQQAVSFMWVSIYQKEGEFQ